ncbi:MAG: AMP-binding protein, partial [Chloroflexi bacterium]|nr:AMP-binding protein [Chloroflexota bacterium]
MKASDLPLYYNVIDILEKNLKDRANKIALYSEARTMTFAQIAHEANQVGNALKNLDVRVGDLVAILALDVPEWVSAYFGIVKIGAVAVGMNTLLKPHEYAY